MKQKILEKIERVFFLHFKKPNNTFKNSMLMLGDLFEHTRRLCIKKMNINTIEVD